MAWGLLGAVCVLMESACLIPQDDSDVPDLPPKKNSPLRVLRMVPEQRETTVLAGPVTEQCKRIEFNVSVRDEDLDDPIRSQWYVDPAPDYSPSPTAPSVFLGSTIFGSTNPTRTVTAPNTMVTYLASLIDGRKHVIEVWVTDGEFQPGPPTQASRPNRVLPDGTSVLDEAFTDNALWLVEVQACP